MQSRQKMSKYPDLLVVIVERSGVVGSPPSLKVLDLASLCCYAEGSFAVPWFVECGFKGFKGRLGGLRLY